MSKEKYKLEEIPIEETVSGETVYNIAAEATNVEGFLYGRLVRKAKEGDKEALRQLKELEQSKVYRVVKGKS